MQITFKDGSFIALNSDVTPGKISVIVCGMKTHREVTMSTLELDESQAQEMHDFLVEWLKENQQS